MKRSSPSSNEEARFRAIRHYHRSNHRQDSSWDAWVGNNEGASVKFWFKFILSVSVVVVVALVVVGALRMGGA